MWLWTWGLLLNVAVSTSGVDISYQKLRQKSAHNSYQRHEALKDQLQYHRIRSLELDIYQDKLFRGSRSGDWFVYHHPADWGTSCDFLSDCLQELKAWSEANPNHEPVTIWVDLKDDEMKGSHSPGDLDKLLTKYLTLWTPGDLLGKKATIVEAVAGGKGWPTTTELRGKFIFVMTDNRDSYANNEEDAEQRKGFVSCRSDSAEDIGVKKNYCAFFNQHCESGGALCKDIYEKGFVSRCWDGDDTDSEREWNAAVENKVHHIATNQINFHADPYAVTHNANGWPFQAMDGTNVDGIPADGNSTLAFYVDSGDIWGEHDDFAFAYLENTADNAMWTTCISNANSDIEAWAKAAIMLRQDVTSKNKGESSSYFAMIRPADDRRLRAQWRNKYKGVSYAKETNIPPDGIDQESRNCIRVHYQYDADSNKSFVKGYGSQDGKTWKEVKTTTINGRLKYHGIGASSHGDQENRDGTHLKHLFTNLKLDGVPVKKDKLKVIPVGNDCPYYNLVDGFF